MNVRIWNSFTSYADNDQPVEIEDVLEIHRSICYGITLKTEFGCLCLPATVVLETAGE